MPLSIRASSSDLAAIFSQVTWKIHLSLGYRITHILPSEMPGELCSAGFTGPVVEREKQCWQKYTFGLVHFLGIKF